MLTRFFNKSEPFGFIAIVLLIVFMILVKFFSNAVFNSIIGVYYLNVLVFQILLLIVASFTISINSLTEQNYYALFVFVLLFGFFPSAITFSKISIAHIFTLLASRQIYGLQYKKDSSLKLFDIGLYISIAYLLYPLTIVFLILAFTAYFFFIKNIEKELFIPILGFITPLFLTYVYFFVFGQTKDFITLIEFNIGFGEVAYNLYPILFIGLLLIFSIYLNIKHFNKGGTDQQLNTKLILLHLLLGVVILLLSPNNTSDSIQLLFFPIAVLLGKTIPYINKNWIKELLLLSLFIGSIVNIFTA